MNLFMDTLLRAMAEYRELTRVTCGFRKSRGRFQASRDA
jgi:hypothetical protein